MCCDYFFRPLAIRATAMLLLRQCSMTEYIHRHSGLSVVVMLDNKASLIEMKTITTQFLIILKNIQAFA